jgi:hypothetical protein
MLADRAYCSITHRRCAFDRLRWDNHGHLLPELQGTAVHTTKDNIADHVAPHSAAAPETVARRLAAVSIKASMSRSRSLMAAEGSLEAACSSVKITA